ncbi:MAG TPA: hypothetical protein VI168_19575 [Croceibacterium sp.]
MQFRHAALAGLLVAQPLAAQDAVPAAAVAPVAAPLAILPPAQPGAMLRIGTELPLRLVEELTTEGKQLKVGDRFRLQTEEPLAINGYTVVPAGAPAIGEVTEVRNKGMWGKSGKLVARLLYVTVNGRQIRLSGGFDDKGVGGVVGAVAVSAIVFAPAGFFMTGTSARVPAGTVIRGYIDEDVPLALPAAARAPLALAAVPDAPAESEAAAPVASTPLPAAPIAVAAPAQAATDQSAFVNPPHRRPPSARNR